MEKKTMLLLTFVLVFISCSAFLISLTFRAPPKPSVTKVRLNFYDYSTEEPIKGLVVNFNITTKIGDPCTITGVSDENGNIVQTLPSNDVAFPILAKNISISGCWVLEESIGEKAWSVADEVWAAMNPQFNYSEYIFDEEVHLSSDRDGSTLNLELDFYLTAGKLITIYDPIPEARYYDQRLRINVLSRNFVGFAGSNYAVVPIEEPLITKLEVYYFIYRKEPLHWEVHISVDVGERTFIDLTPSFIKAISSTQVDVLTRSLNNLKPYGFELTKQYYAISRISILHDNAIKGLENEDYEAFYVHWRSAINLYRDLFVEITKIYRSAVGWTPSLIMILLFFSSCLSRLITDRKDYSIISFIILFSAVFFLFLFTQPYLRLFLSNPLILVQSFTFSLLVQLLVQLLLPILFIVLMFWGQIKSFIWETFEICIRNLRRRKLKTVLSLLTVLVISASAMAFLTITTEKPTSQVLYKGIEPTVDRGLTIYKVMSQEIKTRASKWTTRTKVFHVPVQQYEIEWFSEHEWVEAINVYGIRKISFARSDGFIIGNFSTFSLVVVNSSFMMQYQNVPDVLGIEWFEDIDRNMVIVGSRIAEAYDLEIGSEVFIDYGKYVVKSIVDEETAVKKLKDIDGDLFLFNVFDPLTGKIDGESFIFGTLNDFKVGSFFTYRVSIILKSEYAQNATQIARDIQGLGYDFGQTEDYSLMEKGYLILKPKV